MIPEISLWVELEDGSTVIYPFNKTILQALSQMGYSRYWVRY